MIMLQMLLWKEKKTLINIVNIEHKCHSQHNFNIIFFLFIMLQMVFIINLITFANNYINIYNNLLLEKGDNCWYFLLCS